jgi:hypothetical protein
VKHNCNKTRASTYVTSMIRNRNPNIRAGLYITAVTIQYTHSLLNIQIRNRNPNIRAGLYITAVTIQYTHSLLNIQIRSYRKQWATVTKPMGLSPSWEATSRSATQKLPDLLWNSKIHYRVHKSPPLPLSPARSIQSIPPHPIALRFVLILHSNLRLDLRSCLFPSGFPRKILHAFIFSPARATCPDHLTLLDLINLIIYVASSPSHEAHHYAVNALLQWLLSPWTGRRGPQGCETSRLPHFTDNRLTDVGEVVSLNRRPPFTPRKIPGTHFC